MAKDKIDTTVQTNGTPKQKKARKPVPENETSAQRFRRVGNARLNKAIAAMRGLGMLANTQIYESTEVQRETIMRHLTAGMEAVKAAFAGEQPSRPSLL